MMFLLRRRKKNVGQIICVVIEEDITRAAKKIGLAVEKNACAPGFVFVHHPDFPNIKFAMEEVREGTPEIVKKFIMFSNRKRLALEKKTKPDNN